jgi:pimeloyl-ACP methyl ester carboxylesterase
MTTDMRNAISNSRKQAMNGATTIAYSQIPERALANLNAPMPNEHVLADRLARFADITPRPFDNDGDQEVLDGVRFTHHFIDAPGDEETVRFHYAEAGDGEPIVFLHGIPDSWYQWHHQMAALSMTHRCIAFDLKGYGQSSKGFGDFRHEAAAEQLVGALDLIGVDEFTIVAHDRGSVQADFIAAKHPDRVLRYGRGEQHLYHFHPDLAPQAQLFADAPSTGMMNDPAHFVVWLYTWVAQHPIDDRELRRVVQEFSYPDIARAVPRYFTSQSFRQEWLRRRRDLLPAWRCPVMIIQGYESRTQPREFYEHAAEYIPNSPRVAVEYVEAGHFWPKERPDDITALIRKLLEM